MFSTLLSSKPPLDEESVHWLFETVAWAASLIDNDQFRAGTRLVLPTNEFFPGRADSVHGMAQLVFGRVVEYAGMSRWSLSLSAYGTCPLPTIGQQGPAVIEYDPALVGNPEALIANLALSLASLRVSLAADAPPGGPDNQPFAAEVLAVLMGFGVMMANSAKTIQVRSCGSCGGGQANRQSFLPEDDVTYALAIFCELKDIAPKTALAHLAKPLRPFYKRAAKDVESRPEDLEVVRGLL